MLMLASLAPDSDGIFFWNEGLFNKWHHTFGHNIFTGLIVGAALSVFAARGKRIKWFLIGYGMVALHIFADLVTCPAYELIFFWPISLKKYFLPQMLGVSAQWEPTWNLGLTFILQPLVMIFLIYVTVKIYIKHKRTFFELISPKFDKFITDFAVLPFRSKCDFPGCKNRARYECTDTKSLRCIEHCKINRDLTISCKDA